MDIFERIQGWLLAVRARVREIERYIEDHAESSQITNKVERGECSPPEPTRVTVSFDDETARRAKGDWDLQFTVQSSIRWATWSAFGAATVYALISFLQWSQMLKQTRQSTESFRIDERAWIELEPIHGAMFSARTEKIGSGFVYPIYMKNFGKTVARDVTFRASRNGSQSSITMGDSAEQVAWTQDKLLLGKVPTAADIPVVISVPSVLAPNTSTPIPATLYGQEPQNFPNNEWVSYIIGRIDYTDTFGVPHWVKFCFFVANPRGELWNCKVGNNEDRNSEIPLN